MRSHDALDQLAPGGVDIHRHWEAYATIVRGGFYVEAAIEGRLEIDPHTLVLHPQFHLHSNIVAEAGAVWNVAISVAMVPNTNWFGSWRAFKGAAIDRLAASENPPRAQDVLDAIERAEEMEFEPLPPWLKDIARLDSADFARAQKQVSREHAHRTFKRHFGMAPGRYRRERQLQQAIRLFGSGHALADAAAEAGFTDQSHMTRVMTREFGVTPARFREQITPVQEAG